MPTATRKLSVAKRKEIFIALAYGTKRWVRKHFSISKQQVKAIEQEGLSSGWSPTRKLTVDERKEIFSALVVAQDSRKFTVHGSKCWLRQRFKITKQQVEAIELEGISKGWAPLED